MPKEYNKLFNSDDRILIDSNLLIAYALQKQLAIDLINTTNIKCVSPINIAESLVLHYRRQAYKKISLIKQLLLTFEIYPVDGEVGMLATEICAYLSSIGKGNNIVTADHYIAATCLKHNLKIATINKKDFEYIPKLQGIWFDYNQVFEKD